MNDKEKLAKVLTELIDESMLTYEDGCVCINGSEKIVPHLIAHGVTVQQSARPLEEWGEDYGDVLWWKFPIEEPPYVGSPLDANWPAYHTHWTPIVCPEQPKGE